ncbi:MAG: NmrA family NAD(P)-binding protein [Gemmatimonadota bacterium]
MILLTGAAGKTGRAVTAALASRGLPVRALVRRSGQESELLELGAAESVRGDLLVDEEVGAAMAGIEAVYHVCPNVHPQEEAIGARVLEAARAAGVRRFVFHSVLHPQTERMPHHWRKLRVEERLLESGLDVTVLQPAPYMQNVFAGRDQILEGTYTVPYPTSTRVSMVDLNDVAEAVARVLSEGGHGGAIYELCGSEYLSQDEIAAVLTDELGRLVVAREQAVGEWRRRSADRGLDGERADCLVRMFRYYAEYGLRGNAQALSHLLHRPPTAFTDVVRRECRD